jgi:predicted HicB family RNase H-like nuclease
MEIEDAAKRYRARFSLYLPEALHRELREVANGKLMSANALVRGLIKERLQLEAREQGAAA